MREADTAPITDDATRMPSRAGPPTPTIPSLYDYPASDGKPMGETPWHMQAMVDAIWALKDFFRDRPDVYVGGNMMMYYVEDDTKTSVSPDVFVTFGVPKLPERRVWRTWAEGGRFADFVLEVTSESTRGRDEGAKKDLFAQLGVREYWQFDPEGEYLDPILKGCRLDAEGRYQPLVLEERDGALCHGSLLGLELRLEGERLRFFDPGGGSYLPTAREKDEALRAAQAEIAALKGRLRETGTERLRQDGREPSG